MGFVLQNCTCDGSGLNILDWLRKYAILLEGAKPSYNSFQ